MAEINININSKYLKDNKTNFLIKIYSHSTFLKDEITFDEFTAYVSGIGDFTLSEKADNELKSILKIVQTYNNPDENKLSFKTGVMDIKKLMINIQKAREKRQSYKIEVDDYITQKELNLNLKSVQKIRFTIVDSNPVNFYTEYVYFCPECFTTTTAPFYAVESRRKNVKCSNENSNGKKCGTMLNPDYTSSKQMVLNVCSAWSRVDNSLKRINILTDDFGYTPGEYLGYVFVIDNNNVLLLKANKFEDDYKLTIPDDTNIIRTLSNEMDNYIKDKMGIIINGMEGVKFALILNTAIKYLFDNHKYNIALMGDASTGKTFTLIHYLPLLSTKFNATNIDSVSIPAFRGTKKTFDIFGEDKTIQTIGIFGEYDWIVIDEFLESTDNMMEHLKGFLTSNTYNNMKSGGDGVNRKKYCNLAITGNIKPEFISKYKNKIKYLFKEKVEAKNANTNIKFKKDTWDNKIDLYGPLIEYNFNPILKKSIEEVRNSFIQEGVNWIDGNELASLERFIMTFYLKKIKTKDEQEQEKITDITNAKNQNEYAIQEKLITKEFINYIKDCKKYIHSLDNNEIKLISKWIEIIKVTIDTTLTRRFNKYVTSLIEANAAINHRNKITEKDCIFIFNILKKTNKFIDVSDLDVSDKAESVSKEIIYNYFKIYRTSTKEAYLKYFNFVDEVFLEFNLKKLMEDNIIIQQGDNYIFKITKNEEEKEDEVQTSEVILDNNIPDEELNQ